MGVIADGILRGCQGLFTPVSLGYPLSVFNKNSTLKRHNTIIHCNIGLSKPKSQKCGLSRLNPKSEKPAKRDFGPILVRPTEIEPAKPYFWAITPVEPAQSEFW